MQSATSTWKLRVNLTYSFLAKQYSNSFVQRGQLIQLVDGPHTLLSVNSVEAAAVTVSAKWHAGEPLALVNLMALAWPRSPAHHAVHFLDPRDVLPLRGGGCFLIFALHQMCRCESQTSSRSYAHCEDV